MATSDTCTIKILEVFKIRVEWTYKHTDRLIAILRTPPGAK